MGKLRLKDWKQASTSAGVYVLVIVLLGSLIVFGTVYSSTATPVSGSSNECLITSSEQFDSIVSSRQWAAVMFSSDTCPVCKRMEPHWSQLCSEGDYYILKLNEDTYKIFMRYGVLETPTFIVFTNGTPASRHVGGFTAPHGVSLVTVMKQWAESAAAANASQGLELLRRYCSSCHPVPQGTSKEAIEQWIREGGNDAFVMRFAQAYMSGMTMSQLYNGTSQLVTIILSMNRSLTSEQAEQIALFLDNLAVNTTGPATPTTNVTKPPSNESGQASQDSLAAMGTVAALTAGLIAAFSPCVFPLLLSYTAMLQQRGGDRSLGAGAAVKSGIAAALGVALVGALFLLLGNAVQKASAILVPSAAAVLFAAGILGVLDVPTFVNIGMKSRRGLLGFSFLYGILAVQCSFPLVAGTFMLLAAGGSSMAGQGLLVLAAFTLGIAVPVALAVYASSRPGLRGVLSKAASKKSLRYANGFLAVMGLVMLVYSLGLI